MDMTTTVGRYMVFYHHRGNGRGGPYNNNFDKVEDAIASAECRQARDDNIRPAYILDRVGWGVVHEFK
jgi:hypothetical protein